MARTTTADQVRISDILEIVSNGDFRRRGARTTHGVVREIIHDTADRKTVKRLMVFEILPDDNRLPSGVQYVPLHKDYLRGYGLNEHQTWFVAIDPVGVDIDENRYFVKRQGHLSADDAREIHMKVTEMGGQDDLRLSGGGPTGYAQTNWNNIVSRGYETGLEERERAEPSGKPRKKRGPANVGIVVDLPLSFAGNVTDLDPRIIEALRAKGVQSLRDAKEMADAEMMTFLIPADQPAALADISIDEAIEKGYLEDDTPGLDLVRNPIAKGAPVTTLNELFALAQNGGEGFNVYTGLASKTAKTRAGLIEGTLMAWEFYRTMSPDTQNKNTDVSRQIKTAWSQLMTDYQTFVRPHITALDQGGIMTAPEKIPGKYIENGKLIFTFPKIKID